jgi:AcrR family transcriptional regulator
MSHSQDDTSRALLDAAHRLLEDHGSDALTVRRIATEAGMSTMNVYSRFGGKDGVIDVLYIDGFNRLFATLAEVPTTNDALHDLVESARAYRHFAMANPTYYRIMFRSAIHEFTPSDEASDVALSGLEVFVDRVVAGQQRGDVMAGPQHQAREIAAWLWATCHGLVSLELNGIANERVSWPSIFENGINSVVAGLRPSNVSSNLPVS